MSDCCSPRGYRWVFSERSAEAEAKRYRRKGPDATSKRIIEFVREQGVDGRTVLEVGGGIGAIQLELLRAGATTAVSVEITPTYERAARGLLDEAGLADRVERKVMDFAQAAAQVDGADIVILNRVICCYPDMPRLASAAAGHARRLLVMSYPRRAWWVVAGLGIANWLMWLTRREFRVFAHRPSEIIATGERTGMHTVLDERGFLWTVAGLQRPA